MGIVPHSYYISIEATAYTYYAVKTAKLNLLVMPVCKYSRSLTAWTEAPRPERFGQSQPGLERLGQSQPGLERLGQSQPGLERLGQSQPRPERLGQSQPGLERLGQSQPGLERLGQSQPGLERLGQSQPRPEPRPIIAWTGAPQPSASYAPPCRPAHGVAAQVEFESRS